MLLPVDPPDWMADTRALGAALRAGTYRPRAVAQAIGIIAWNGKQMDGRWWERANCAEGVLGDQVELLLRGGRISSERARAALPEAAWSARLLDEGPEGVTLDGTIVPLEFDLVWTDTPTRAFTGNDGLFLPDSTTLAVRRCLPSDPVARHLDLGSGGGGVAARAARSALETIALDINPRAGLGCHRTAALSGLPNIRPYTGAGAEACTLGTFDRVSFVLPLLVPWSGLAAAPVHTVAEDRNLLREVLELLPTLLAPGGLAVLYTQAWAGDRFPGGGVRDTLAAAFGSRPWRGAYWWDYEGPSPIGPLRAGILAVRADRTRGYVEAPLDAVDVGVDDWWPGLARLLGEG
jgi:SAM-dependent methyltransferase